LIQINKHQLQQIEYLLDQSAKGFHLLFDPQTVKRILSQPTENLDFFTFENINKVQQILSDFLDKKSVMEKQRFIETLDSETFELLVRSYFNILDNTIFEATKLKH
jgi:hypothetical protein